MMKRAIKSVLFLLLFNLSFEVTRSEITRIGDGFGQKTHGQASKEADDTMIRRIEEEMLLLNKSEDPTRDKRALGILLQGFMEALGYTVTPIQLASLPNPSAAAQMPAGPAAAAPPAGGMMPMTPMMPMMRQAAMMPAAMMPAMMPNASASAPARQRETLRFTGLLNFGNSENTTNLINHLSQYENLFHGNRSAAAPASTPAAPMMPAAPAPAAGPDIDPRYAPPLKEPLFVKIPLPIAPDLPPPQPPSPMPLDHSFHHNEYYNKDSSEEFSSSKDDDGQRGTFDEEDDDTHHSEDFEFKHDKYHDSEDRNYENKGPDESYEQPKSKEKHVERGYQNNKSVENYNVENKEIRDPSEVAEEAPAGGSKFNHATYVDEPNWRQEQDEKVYNLAAEQEARAEALAEENAEREKQKEKHGHDEEDEEFHRSREKEIDEANEEHDARYDKKPYNEDEANEEEDSSSEKDGHDDARDYKDDGDEANEEKEADHEERGTQKTEAKVPNEAGQPVKSYQDADFYPATLPISPGPEMPQKGETLRDSYGAALEKPGGHVDERVAEYITMFKNPQTGVYDDPGRGREYEHARISFDHGDLIDGFNRIQKEYGPPENKYEEYEIEPERVEHRGTNDDDSSESSHEPECHCAKKKKKKRPDVQTARSSERSVTQPPPLMTSPQPAFGYGPYYSGMKYTYDPLEQDRNREIIARLTTYDTPTTVRFEEDHYDVLHNHSRSTIGPTIPPERLTTLSFLHEAEAEEMRAWPAPFDFLYDNSEHKSVVYKKSPPVASSPAPFKPTRPSCNQHMMPFGEHKDKVKLLFGDHSAERYTNNDRVLTKPNNYHGNRRAKPSEKVHKRVEYFPNFSTTQATVFEQRKRLPSNEKRLNYRTSTKPPPRTPSLSEILTPPPARLRSTKSPRKNRKSIKILDQTQRPAAAKYRETTVKPTIKVKYTYPFGAQGNAKEETTNYVEKDGMLIIPEPTPYYFNEGFDEFTEEPQSNTERVQIKEYRNHIASVKVSELKQLHPEGSMQIFKYTRNL